MPVCCVTPRQVQKVVKVQLNLWRKKRANSKGSADPSKMASKGLADPSKTVSNGSAGPPKTSPLVDDTSSSRGHATEGEGGQGSGGC